MRLNLIILLLACCLGLHAQGDFAICQNAGPEFFDRARPTRKPNSASVTLYAIGRGVPKDMSAAVTHFRAAAEKGYTPAQAVLGVNYARGLGVAQNWTEAARWFRQAMIGGHAGAALNLGQCYQNGNGVPQDREQAASLYRFAAAHGDARAALLLAKLNGTPAQPLSDGSRQQASAPINRNYALDQDKIPWRTYRVPPERVAQIIREDRECYIPQPGIVTCRGNLTGNYGQVEVRANAPSPAQTPQAAQTFPIPSKPPPAGVPPAQQAEAERLWQRAVVILNRNAAREAMPVLYQCALLGDRRAEATLGIRYQDGNGVGADDRIAAYWFGLAAAQGHRASQYALAGMYLEGEGGLPKDLKKGTELLIKSANQGYDKAQLALGISYEFGEGVPRDRAKAIALIRMSQDADDIAAVLANPRTPARFANEDEFANYLTSLRNAEIAASWARARASWGGGSGRPGGPDWAGMNAAQRAHAAENRGDQDAARRIMEGVH